jgi:hypothetical protein
MKGIMTTQLPIHETVQAKEEVRKSTENNPKTTTCSLMRGDDV